MNMVQPSKSAKSPGDYKDDRGKIDGLESPRLMAPTLPGDFETAASLSYSLRTCQAFSRRSGGLYVTRPAFACGFAKCGRNPSPPPLTLAMAPGIFSGNPSHSLMARM